jgi:hypothetical protein
LARFSTPASDAGKIAEERRLMWTAMGDDPDSLEVCQRQLPMLMVQYSRVMISDWPRFAFTGDSQETEFEPERAAFKDVDALLVPEIAGPMVVSLALGTLSEDGLGDVGVSTAITILWDEHPVSKFVFCSSLLVPLLPLHTLP